MKSAPKRKSAKRKAARDEDYEPATAAAPVLASSETSYPKRKQQSSPHIGVTKVFCCILVYCCLGFPLKSTHGDNLECGSSNADVISIFFCTLLLHSRYCLRAYVVQCLQSIRSTYVQLFPYMFCCVTQ